MRSSSQAVLTDDSLPEKPPIPATSAPSSMIEAAAPDWLSTAIVPPPWASVYWRTEVRSSPPNIPPAAAPPVVPPGEGVPPMGGGPPDERRPPHAFGAPAHRRRAARAAEPFAHGWRTAFAERQDGCVRTFESHA